MFEFIKGKLISKKAPKAVIENNGIGYELLCSKRTLSLLPNEDSEAVIYTKLIHREDEMFLCGFFKKEEKNIFDILTKVSGIGTKMALNLLDEFDIDELIGAVIREDYKFISKAKGVGIKLAQKIILELKDKLTNAATNFDIAASFSKINNKISEDTLIEVQTVLESLGWNSNEYSEAIKIGIELIKQDNSEELLKETLKILSSK